MGAMCKIRISNEAPVIRAAQDSAGGELFLEVNKTHGRSHLIFSAGILGNADVKPRASFFHGPFRNFVHQCVNGIQVFVFIQEHIVETQGHLFVAPEHDGSGDRLSPFPSEKEEDVLWEGSLKLLELREGVCGFGPMTFLVFQENRIERRQVIGAFNRYGTFTDVFVNISSGRSMKGRYEIVPTQRDGVRNIVLVDLKAPVRQCIVEILGYVPLVNERSSGKKSPLEVLVTAIVPQTIHEFEREGE